MSGPHGYIYGSYLKGLLLFSASAEAILIDKVAGHENAKSAI
jgi:hypothetical protein